MALAMANQKINFGPLEISPVDSGLGPLVL